MTSKDNTRTPFRFSPEEFAGAIGDFGTIIPLVLGVVLVSDLHPGHVLLFVALAYIITGVYYRLPVPVEPMKAIGAIVIAGELTHGEIVASGLIVGVLFLMLGFFRSMKTFQRLIPKSVIHGIQLGLALILLRTSYDFITLDPGPAMVGVLVVVVFLLMKRFLRVPDVAALVLIVMGVVWGLVARGGAPPPDLIPMPKLIIPSLSEWMSGFWELAVPQAPLTLTNAILATSLLFHDMMGKDVQPDRLAKSTGVMNIISVPLGGFPMCHGAGGLAAQYRFGARTGGSNIISGLILLPVAVWFSGSDHVALISYGIFGAMLLFVAIELGKYAFRTQSVIVTVSMAAMAFFAGFAVAFVVGMGLHWGMRRIG